MWQKLKDQIPAIVLTVLLIGGVAYWVHNVTVNDMTRKEQADLQPLREQNDVLKAETEENREQLSLLNKTLSDAIANSRADVFKTDAELQRLNQQRMDALAAAIAKKIEPYSPLPTTPQEAERMQNEQIDKVSSRMAQKIEPILDRMANDQHLTRESIASYSRQISQQVGGVLQSEMNKNQQLNNNLQETQEVAEESIALSHEITALYLSSFKDQGLITRLLSLPANVVKDAASLSIVNSSDKKKVEQDLVNRMNSIEQRLQQIEAQNPEAKPATKS